MKLLKVLALVFLVSMFGCSNGDKPHASVSDTNQVYNPMEQDDDDKILNEPAVESDYEADGIVDGSAVSVDEGMSDEYGSYTYSGKGSFKTYGTRNGGRQAWRIPGPMSKYGKVCKVVFSGGGTYYVVAQKANRSNKGFVWKKGSHGGPYIHARYGNSSQYVNISCR